MKTRQKTALNPLWLRLGAVTIPLALVILFELLKGNQPLMTGWVFGVMAPLERLLGRLCSIFPFCLKIFELVLIANE